MGEPKVTTRTRTKAKVELPRLHKVLLLNDDYTPRNFVVTVLRTVFGVPETRAYNIMWAAHVHGVSVVAVYTRDVAETKSNEGTDEGRRAGYPLQFTTEPEE